jgi:uncharacterized DUF497 family protein
LTVDFAWDEAKREWVLAERGIDFLRVAFALFDGRPLLTVPTPRDDEDRFLSIGLIEGKADSSTALSDPGGSEMLARNDKRGWTWRDNAMRIITARRARDEEEKRYRALYG